MARCGQVAAFLALPCPPERAAFCQRPMQTSPSVSHQPRWAYFGSNGSSAQCPRQGRQPGLSCSEPLPWRMTSASRHVWPWTCDCVIRSGISRCDQIQNPVLELQHRIEIVLLGMAWTKQSQQQKVRWVHQCAWNAHGPIKLVLHLQVLANIPDRLCTTCSSCQRDPNKAQSVWSEAANHNPVHPHPHYQS